MTANTRNGREKRIAEHNPAHHRTPHTATNTATHKRKRNGNNAREGGPDPRTGHRSTHHPPPFNRTTRQTKGTPILTGGDTTRRREGLASQPRPSFVMPPTIHNAPTHHHDEGVAHRGYPTTRTVQRHTPPTHHTPGNGRRMTRPQCRRVLHRDRQSMGYTTGQCRPAAAHTTAIPQQHTDERRTPSTHHHHSFMFTRPTNDHDQHDQRSMFNQQTLNNE